MFVNLVKTNPALAPLFLFGGSGIAAGIAYMGHCLRNNPDVIIAKTKPEKPWERIQPHENVKLWSPNKAFWEGRKANVSSSSKQ